MTRGRPKKPVEPNVLAFIQPVLVVLLYRDPQTRRPAYPQPTQPTCAQSVFALADSRELIMTIVPIIPSADAMLLICRSAQ